MAIAIIQFVGVFLTAFVGLPTILFIIHKRSIPPANFFCIAVGLAMISTGLFF